MILTLHVKGSEKMYERYELLFNTLVMQQKPGMKTIIVNGKPKKIYEHTAFTLKHTHRTTVNYILRAFYAHLNYLRDAGLPYDTPFEVSSEAIATMKGCCSDTINRHFNRLNNLTDDGKEEIIKMDKRKSVFKDFELFVVKKEKTLPYSTITLNPKYLLAELTPELKKIVKTTHPEWLKNDVNNDVNGEFKSQSKGLNDLSSLPPISLFFPLKSAKCGTIELQETPINENIGSGKQPTTIPHFLNADDVSKQDTINKTLGSINPPQEKTALQLNSSHELGKIARADKKFLSEKFALPERKDKYGNSISWFIERAFFFLITFLNEGRPVSGENFKRTATNIYILFSSANSYQQQLLLFMRLVNLRANYQKNHPGRFELYPWIWTDPKIRGQIKATHEYYLSSVLPREEKNKAWNSSLRAFEDSVMIYWKNESIPGAYQSCTKKIGRKGEGKFLDAFHKCFRDKSKYEETVKELKNSFYQ